VAKINEIELRDEILFFLDNCEIRWFPGRGYIVRCDEFTMDQLREALGAEARFMEHPLMSIQRMVRDEEEAEQAEIEKQIAAWTAKGRRGE
jgi:hypothetical protein